MFLAHLCVSHRSEKKACYESSDVVFGIMDKLN